MGKDYMIAAGLARFAQMRSLETVPLTGFP
jgi:hypothetical protein